MAVIHRAYTFDPARFHQNLQKHIVDGEAVRDDRLVALARNIVIEASPVTRQALEMVRFDEEWLNPPDGDIWPTQLYIALLTGELSAAPSLTHRFPLGWIVLERVLSLTNWTSDDISDLIHGRSLRELLVSSDDEVLISHFDNVLINQYGGWIDLGHASKLYAQLLEARDFFLPSNVAVLEATNEISTLRSQEPGQVLQHVYADATEMLETTLQRQQALFIVRD